MWWFYVTGLLPFTLISIIIWCIRGFRVSNRIDFVTHYLANDASMENERSSNKSYSRFVLDYLGIDGVLILRLIEINHGSTVLTVILQNLYERSSRRPVNASFRSTESLSSITANFCTVGKLLLCFI